MFDTRMLRPLRPLQQHGDHGPEQRADERRHHVGPARQRRAADDPHEQHESRAQREQHGHLRRLLPKRKRSTRRRKYSAA
jgi:hypothetical protein